MPNLVTQTFCIEVWSERTSVIDTVLQRQNAPNTASRVTPTQRVKTTETRRR